jgi:hypothetical protein
MSFILEPDLSLTPSITAESTTTSQAYRKGKKTSPIWAHCHLPIEDEDQDLLYCSYCIQDLTPPLYGSSNSSAMTKHINRHHSYITIEKALSKNQEAINQQLRQLYRQAKTNGDAKEFNLEILEASLNVPVFTKALITLIVVQNLSFAIVE